MWINLTKKNKSDLTSIPENTGVYKFYDKKEELLYVGKALNLKARISSYFRDTHLDRPHIIAMLPLVEKVQIVETDNEVESVILESALVKKYQPRFNIRLKDDKSFSWIYISTQEKFPKVSIVRSIKKGEYRKGKLFGPFPKGKVVRNIFDYIRKVYPFRTCDNFGDLCLYYHLDLCPGPCGDKISEQEYRKNIDNIIKFLNGRQRNIIKDLERKMYKHASKQDYEEASNLRDKINDLEYMSQKIHISPYEDDAQYITSRYERMRKSLSDLEQKVGLKKIRRIECYDISNIKGQFGYGAMAVSLDAKLEKSEYRIFKIKEDDLSDINMLQNVLQRRLQHIGRDTEDKSLVEKPDLILIDGGRSHVSFLRSIVSEDIALLGISKGKHMRRKGHKSYDEFWWHDGEKVRKIKMSYPQLFVDLRDEAHRFGIKHYRKNMGHYSTRSVLDSIEGIGIKRRKKLLKHFKSLENIKKANVEELNEVLKNKKLAERVSHTLKN